MPTVGIPAAYTPGSYSGSPAPTLQSRSWKVDGVEVGTGPNYTPVMGDQGKTLTISETVSNAGGSITSSSAGVVVAPAVAPTVTTAPALIGSPVVGIALAYTPGTYSGTPAPTLLSRSWKVDGIEVGTGLTYTPVIGDAGKTITISETVSNVAGSVTGTSAGASVRLAPAVTSNPVILGTPTVGVAVAYTAGTYTGTPTPTLTSRSWQVDGVEVATTATYTPVLGDVGKALTISETFTNSGGSVTGISSSLAVASNAVAPGVSASPSIIGTPIVGNSVSYTAGTYTGTPAPTLTSRSWRVDGVEVATTATYTPVIGDTGKTLTIRETFTNSSGSITGISSGLTVSNTPNVAPAVTANPVIIGTPQVGVAAAYTSGSYSGSPAPTLASRSWKVDGVEVATTATYTPVTGDATKSLTISETFTNVAGSATGTSSGATIAAASAGLPGFSAGTYTLDAAGLGSSVLLSNDSLRWKVITGFQMARGIGTTGRVGDPTGVNTRVLYEESPTSDDYAVEIDFFIFANTSTTTPTIGLLARGSLSPADMYQARFRRSDGWTIFRTIAGAGTAVGGPTGALTYTISTNHTARFEVSTPDASTVNLKLIVDGVTLLNVNDTNAARITARGFGGFSTTSNNADGPQISKWRLSNLAAQPRSGFKVMENGFFGGNMVTLQRAIYRAGKTYVGALSSRGTVRVGAFDHSTLARTGFTLSTDAFDKDDHACPSLLFKADDKLAAAYSAHDDPVGMRVRNATNTNSLEVWDAQNTLAYAGTISYSTIIYMAAQGLYYFFSKVAAPTTRTSDLVVRTTSDFVTFGAEQILIDETGNRPYMVARANGSSRIDILYNQGNPDEVAGNNTLHGYIEWNGSAAVVKKSDGTVVGNLGTGILSNSTGTLIYDETSPSSTQIADMIIGGDGHPRVLFWIFFGGTTPTDPHRLMYSRWTGSAWTTPVMVVDAGNSISTTESFANGGACFDSQNQNRIYCSVKVSSTWEMQRFDTADSGATWTKTLDITTGSGSVKNIRPISPIGHNGEMPVIWCKGTYTDYQNFSTEVVGYTP